MRIFITISFTVCATLLIGQSSLPTTVSVVVPEVVQRHDGYYSNYFSFHGADSLGRIYFAIDNNRERTKKKYKCNNFLYFNVDNEWKQLEGHENFESDASDIELVPSSDHFEFQYDDDIITDIISQSNDIELSLSEPLRKIGDYGNEGVLFEIYSTKTTLQYKDRVVEYSKKGYTS